jgi:hypothetical protein
LEKCATDEPGTFLKVCASLMPRDLTINTNIGVNAQSVLETFRVAVEALGNKPPGSLPKVIDAR